MPPPLPPPSTNAPPPPPTSSPRPLSSSSSPSRPSYGSITSTSITSTSPYQTPLTSPRTSPQSSPHPSPRTEAAAAAPAAASAAAARPRKNSSGKHSSGKTSSGKTSSGGWGALRSAATLLHSLRRSNIRLREKDGEWYETHVDIFQSSSRTDLKAMAMRRNSPHKSSANDLASLASPRGGEPPPPALSSGPSPAPFSPPPPAPPSSFPPASLPALLWEIVQTPCLIVLIGLLTSAVCIATNFCVARIYSFRHALVVQDGGAVDGAVGGVVDGVASAPSAPAPSAALRFLLYLLLSVSAACLGNWVTQTVCPSAAGGGIPDVKALLDGSYKRALVAPRTVLAKAAGLVLGYSAGLSVGKEGPFVHIAVAIADTLMRQPPFRRVARDDAKRLEVLACAAAAGVGATFGTPFGAVVFSIEVTGHYFMVRNLPRAFLCAVAGTLPMALLGYNKVFSLFSDLPKMAQGYDVEDLFCFVLLGFLCGGLGCVFIKLVERMIIARNAFVRGQAGKRYTFVVVMTALVAPFVFFDLKYGVASSGDQRSITNFMFQTSSVEDMRSLHVWLYFPMKLFITVISVTLPLPVGLFTPVFLIGGTFGRLFGEGLRWMGEWSAAGDGASVVATLAQRGFHPWEFALIGAAAFSAGVTRAISTAIIILELSGEHHLRTPTAVAVITAYYVGNRFTKSVYDVLMDTNKTPVLADLPDSLRNSTAADVMTPIPSPPPAHLPVISTTHTARQAIAVIEKAAATPSGLTDYRVLPVVDSLETMVLLGSVKVGDLRNAVSDIASAATMMASDSSLLDQRLVFVTNETGVLKVFGGAKRGKIVPHTWTTPLDPAPFQIQHQMQMTKIYLVFRMLKLNLAWVVSSGVLVGCVDREGLRNYVGGREKRRTDKVKVLWSMLVGARDRGGGGGGGEDDAEEDDEEALFIEDEGGSDVVGPGFLRI